MILLSFPAYLKKVCYTATNINIAIIASHNYLFMNNRLSKKISLLKANDIQYNKYKIYCYITIFFIYIQTFIGSKKVTL